MSIDAVTAPSSSSDCAYVTMLTDDSFLPGVRCLHLSLSHTGTPHPLVVMVTEHVSRATRMSLEHFATTCEVSVLPIHCQPHLGNPTFASTQLTKINIWRMTQFRKLVYIDADCLVVSSLDSLFHLNSPFAAAPDIFPPDKVGHSRSPYMLITASSTPACLSSSPLKRSFSPSFRLLPPCPPTMEATRGF